MTEIGVYTVLAAGVASAIFIAGGRPVWHVVVVGASAALIIVVLTVVSRRAGHPVPAFEPEPGHRSNGQVGPDEQSIVREQYARHNPYTRPSTNTQPIPYMQAPGSTDSNPYVEGNPYAEGAADIRPERAAAVMGDGPRRGRRRRH